MISSQYNFIYLHPPKTAGNSIQSLLLPHSDDRKAVKDHQDGTERFSVVGPVTDGKHSKIAKYGRKLGREFKKYRIAISVREPLDRALSLYFSPHRWQQVQDDGEFVEQTPYWDEEKFRAMVERMPTLVDFLRYKWRIQKPEFVIRFEHLHEDFEAMCKTLNIPETGEQLKHINTSTDVKGLRGELRENERVRKWVDEKFKEDRKYFGY